MTSPAPDMTKASTDFLPRWRPMLGLALRHWYLYRQSWPRLVEMMYWPMVNMITFGFVSLSILHYFSKDNGAAGMVADSYVAGLMLMELLQSCLRGTLVMYMEELWSHNLGHLFASPLRVRDYFCALLGLSTLRGFVSVIPAFALVYWLFHFSIFRLGWLLPVYAGLLYMNAWWHALMVVALLLRVGLAAEWMGWMSLWMLMPFMAPYYPVSVLPLPFRIVSRMLPGSYVFDSMKAQIADGAGLPNDLWLAFALNLAYLALAVFLVTRAFAAARRSGNLLSTGE